MIAQEAQNNSLSTIELEDLNNLMSMKGVGAPANSWSTIDQEDPASLWSMTGVGVQIDSLLKTQPNRFQLMRERGAPANLWSMIGLWVLMPLTSLAKEGRLGLKNLLLLSVKMWETHKNITDNSCNNLLELNLRPHLISSCLNLLIK
jgi:hypothetical protein